MTHLNLISGGMVLLLLICISQGLSENSSSAAGSINDLPADEQVRTNLVDDSSLSPFLEKKPHALVVVAPSDFNEEELKGVISALEEAKIGYDIASTASGAVDGMSGGTIKATISFNDVTSLGIAPYNGIIIIGGEGAITSLYDNLVLRELVRAFDQEEKIVSAICASPVILSRAGILQKKTVTLFRDPQLIEEVQASGARVSSDPVVTDRRIITGIGPDAAVDFGRTVAAALQ
ncbi:MAG TPA: DJ-1/PfpI family protein [Methanospirillum sp.]|nr:DJ-1/PfpI family protein [Methanospirillum sp.]